MNFPEALARIESPEFDAELNVVSGTGSFFQAVAGDSTVRALLEAMDETGFTPEQILGRIYELSMFDPDPRYENPYDTALAVLLWLTAYTDDQLANVGAHYVQLAPRCWYATRLANQVIAPSSSRSSEYRTPTDHNVARSTHNSSTAERWNAVSTASRAHIVTGPSQLTSRSDVSSADDHMVELSYDNATGGDLGNHVPALALRSYTSRSQILEMGNTRGSRGASRATGA